MEKKILCCKVWHPLLHSVFSQNFILSYLVCLYLTEWSGAAAGVLLPVYFHVKFWMQESHYAVRGLFLSPRSSSRGVDLANAGGTHPLSAGDSLTQLHSLQITHMQPVQTQGVCREQARSVGWIQFSFFFSWVCSVWLQICTYNICLQQYYS